MSAEDKRIITDRWESCPEREPQLEALLFEELEPSARLELEAHIESCQGCRHALDEARTALEGLALLQEAPLPMAEPQTETDASSSEADWSEFRRRLNLKERDERPEDSVLVFKRRWSGFAQGMMAAAALVVLGVGIGRFSQVSTPQTSVALGGPALPAEEGFTIDPAAVDALERAELLSDLGVHYVMGLRRLLGDVMQVSVDGAAVWDQEGSRELARELIRDGRFLRQVLDRGEDGGFLKAIDRAEIFLEELAVAESTSTSTNVMVIQATLQKSGLPDQLAAIDVDSKVAAAIAASGWLAEEAP